MIIENILLVIIIFLLYMIYRKNIFLPTKNEKNTITNNNESTSIDEIDEFDKIVKFDENDLELLTYLTPKERKEFDVPADDYKGCYSAKTLKDKLKDSNSNLHRAIMHIKTNGVKTNTKMELRKFPSLMVRYKEFLNQSKEFKKLDVIETLDMISVEPDTVDDMKIFFLSYFSKLIFSNDLTFNDLLIDNAYYGYGPSEVKFIWFDVENVTEIRDGIDYKVYNADVIFILKDNSRKVIKCEFYNNMIEQLDKWYKVFVYKDYHSLNIDESYNYYSSYNSKAKYKIVLNDLFQYLDFTSTHYYNKKFTTYKSSFSIKYEYETFLTNDYGEYIDSSWQIDKKNFTYVTETSKTKEIKIIDTMTNDELFIYTIELYYKTIFEEIKDRYKVVKYLDKLIEKDYPMAYLAKALLHLDGQIVLKDISKAKIYLHKSYDLGLHSPSLLIWNENNLFEKI